MEVKNLASLPKEKFTQFLETFETIIFDLDGVLYTSETDIPGAKESIAWLRKLGKKIRFASNNSGRNLEALARKLNVMGYSATSDDCITPVVAVIAYLKKMKFEKKLFVIGPQSAKDQLSNAGIQLADEGPVTIEDTAEAIAKIIIDDEAIGAVLIDHDVNLNYSKILRAITYLSRDEVIFLTGVSDKKLPYFPNVSIIGPEFVQNAIAEFVKRHPVHLGKPSPNFGEYVKEKFKIEDPSKCLFIGDSLYQDMKFATTMGFKKLIVLTGNTKLTDLKTLSEDVQPDYYIKSVGDLHKLTGVKNLASLSRVEYLQFIKSFETIIFDLDGVLYTSEAAVSGAKESVAWLRSLGKKIRFASNNSGRSLEALALKLTAMSYSATVDDCITPVVAIIAYLKKLKFEKKLFVVGPQSAKDQLSKAGIQLADEGPVTIEDTADAVAKVIVDDEKIGAVLIDHDVNLNYSKILRAITYLSRDGVLFLTGVSDKRLPYFPKVSIIGPEFVQTAIENFVKKSPVRLGKPSQKFGEYLKEKFEITDPSKCLFIGDSLLQDVAFATTMGFKKLVVLSGNTKLADVHSVSGAMVPDYYVGSVGDLHFLAQA